MESMPFRLTFCVPMLYAKMKIKAWENKNYLGPMLNHLLGSIHHCYYTVLFPL